MVESQLLRHREAVHHSSVDQSVGEGVLGIPELFLTFDIGLPTGALGVEDDGMNIDLACAAGNECNATRSPVRHHPVTMPAERLQQVIERHLGDIDGDIEVAVDPGLMPNQCVDTPPAGNPDAVKPCPVRDTQHSADIGSGHVPASVVTDVCHHEASQAGAKLSGTGWPTAQRSCRSPTLERDLMAVEDPRSGSGSGGMLGGVDRGCIGADWSCEI
jgi:hypothetical protein